MEISLRQAGELLRTAQRIIITGHIHPDGDSLGSMLALYHYLATCKKHVRLFLDDAVPALYRFLPGWQNVSKPQDYQADLLVILDASDRERIGSVKDCVMAPCLNIDHHISNTKFADYWHIDAAATATGSIIYELLQNENASITEEMAICLYTAIATDCGFFRYGNTTAKTMRQAAGLLEYGVKPEFVAQALETKPVASVKALVDVLETLEIYDAGKVACITLPPAILAAEENTDDFIHYPRSIEGVEVAIMFKPVEESVTRVSFRSRTIDVSQLALAFGGGGHARAAGCTINGELQLAKQKTLSAVSSLLRSNKS